ncbi:hypothetical protein Hanom_Chr01g00078391 [Helianthus anomalus]
MEKDFYGMYTRLRRLLLLRVKCLSLWLAFFSPLVSNFLKLQRLIFQFSFPNSPCA